MDIDDQLLTDIKGMIKIAGQKGNTVVGPDDSENGSINNEEIPSSAPITYTTRRHQSDQPPISFVQLPQQQQQRCEKIATTKGRRRWLQKRFLFFFKKRDRNSGSNNNSNNNNRRNNSDKRLEGLIERYEAQSLQESCSTCALQESCLTCDNVGDLVRDGDVLGKFV